VSSVADDITELFAPGRYGDRLRVTIDGTPDLLWTGCIWVGANLFVIRPPARPVIPRVRPYSVAIGVAPAECKQSAELIPHVTAAEPSVFPPDVVMYMGATKLPRYSSPGDRPAVDGGDR
jgi:hypothetical protein